MRYVAADECGLCRLKGKISEHFEWKKLINYMTVSFIYFPECGLGKADEPNTLRRNWPFSGCRNRVLLYNLHTDVLIPFFFFFYNLWKIFTFADASPSCVLKFSLRVCFDRWLEGYSVLKLFTICNCMDDILLWCLHGWHFSVNTGVH